MALDVAERHSIGDALQTKYSDEPLEDDTIAASLDCLDDTSGSKFNPSIINQAPASGEIADAGDKSNYMLRHTPDDDSLRHVAAKLIRCSLRNDAIVPSSVVSSRRIAEGAND